MVIGTPNIEDAAKWGRRWMHTYMYGKLLNFKQAPPTLNTTRSNSAPMMIEVMRSRFEHERDVILEWNS